jgi:hypothetical protein
LRRKQLRSRVFRPLKVESRINELADVNGKHLGLSRRQFLHTSCGMAAAFLGMNDIYGNVFRVAPAEAREPELMLARAQSLAGQFIFDVQTHFVRDDFDHKELLNLGKFASEHWNPKMKEEGVSSLARYKFQNYVKEIYYDSDTNLALLSGAPFDDPSWWLLSNEQIVKARELINDFAGSRRLLEIPEDMQKKYGFAPLGDANSASMQIFAGNATRFYKIKLRAADNTRMPAFSEDRLAALKNEYAMVAKEPSNLRYGYVRAA